MKLTTHALSGCPSRPLASYLKAVAVLRLVAEQSDPQARGYWKKRVFHLVTHLDEQALERFFLYDWAPTAYVSPWNKGSGFFSAKDKGLTPVESSQGARFAPLRAGVAQARALTEAMEQAVHTLKGIKEESNRIKDRAARDALRSDAAYKQRLAQAEKNCKKLKDALQAECQRRWRGGALRWLRAAVVIDGDGASTFPALLGVGGGDGNLDFTNNAYQRMADLFDLAGNGGPKPGAAIRLRAALWGESAPGQLKGAIGQYAPAASGGANATTGALGKSLLNPWDLLLLLEGAILFTAGTTRRLLGRAAPQAAAPFAVRTQACGYGSASKADEGPRGEQWMPLWERPWSLPELQSVLCEGRAQIGARPSETAQDLARAVSRLGVARGIQSFERYGYLERNGKSNYAVPLGLWRVHHEPKASLLDDLDAREWWARVKRAARDDRAPASFVRAERVFGDAVMSALARGGNPERWEAVLVALARLEAQMVRSGTFTAAQRLSPIPKLSAGWVEAVDDNSPEFRLAMGLAGARAGTLKDGRPFDGVRAHWLPLLPSSTAFHVGEKTLARDPRVVMEGRNPINDLMAMVQRRLLEAESGTDRRLPLRAHPGWEAATGDLEFLLAGEVDLDRVIWLARALAALDWHNVRRGPKGIVSELEPGYMALRLTHLPLWKELEIPVDPAPLRLLAAGQGERAFQIVLRRLRVRGISPPVQVVALDPALARLYAASLAFPIGWLDAQRFVRRLDPASYAKELSHVGSDAR